MTNFCLVFVDRCGWGRKVDTCIPWGFSLLLSSSALLSPHWQQEVGCLAGACQLWHGTAPSQRFEHVRAPQFCRWGEEHTEQSLLSQLVDWTPASEPQKGEILCSCTHSSPPCSPHWTGRGRTLLSSATLWWKKGVKRRDWFHWLVMNLQRFQ